MRKIKVKEGVFWGGVDHRSEKLNTRKSLCNQRSEKLNTRKSLCKIPHMGFASSLPANPSHHSLLNRPGRKQTEHTDFSSGPFAQ
jgi:hypothetical protein